jgi:hypothetical protein
MHQSVIHDITAYIKLTSCCGLSSWRLSGSFESRLSCWSLYIGIPTVIEEGRNSCSSRTRDRSRIPTSTTSEHSTKQTSRIIDDIGHASRKSIAARSIVIFELYEIAREYLICVSCYEDAAIGV